MFCDRNNKINVIHERALKLLLVIRRQIQIRQIQPPFTKNVQLLTIEIYKTENDFNLKFISEIFVEKKISRPLGSHNNQSVQFPQTHTVPRRGFIGPGSGRKLKRKANGNSFV